MGRTSKQIKDTFSSTDFSNLCDFRYASRFLPNRPILGNIVICGEGPGAQILQFAMPKGKKNTPLWQPLHDIRLETHYGVTGYSARSQGGTLMYAPQSYHCTDQDGGRIKICLFSPADSKGKKPFWGNKKRVPIMTAPVPGYTTTHIKGGRELEVDPASIGIRMAQKRRPTQKKVMGMSAAKAYALFLEKWGDKLSAEMRQIFDRALRDDRHFSLEWLHGEGYTLTPVGENPQRKDNMGAAPSWANSNMLILERMAQWYARQCRDVKVSIRCEFKMLLDSELIDQIDFEVKISKGKNFLKFEQSLDALRDRHPVFKPPSDSAQLTGIAHALLYGTKPYSNAPLSVIRQEDKQTSSSINPYYPERKTRKKSYIPALLSNTKPQSIAMKESAKTASHKPRFFTKPLQRLHSKSASYSSADSIAKQVI